MKYPRILAVIHLFPQRREHRDSALRQTSPRNVIGKDLLAEIWADMARSVLPSWIQAAPSRWGIPSAGKLSADEYKVVCSISLVVTLIRVWGYGNKEQPQSRHFQMLLNFLELVRSMHIIFLRETSQSSRAYYKTHILNYLRGVLQLFPDVTLASNHHLALHIVTDLENMGPGHARSTPVFERINHLLQEIKKNGHLGKDISRAFLLILLIVNSRRGRSHDDEFIWSNSQSAAVTEQLSGAPGRNR